MRSCEFELQFPECSGANPNFCVLLIGWVSRVPTNQNSSCCCGRFSRVIVWGWGKVWKFDAADLVLEFSEGGSCGQAGVLISYLSPGLWMLIPGWRIVLGAGHALCFPWGLVPGTPAWGLRLPTFFGVGDAWKLLCFIRAFSRRFSTSWFLSLLFGARDLGKFRDCHTYVEERGIWSQISGLECVLHPWLVCAFLSLVPQSSLTCKMK